MLSLKPWVKTPLTASSCCLSIIPGVVAKMRNAASRRPASGDWLAWKRTPRSSGHCSPEEFTHQQSGRGLLFGRGGVPLSVYCRATSAMASPILFLTSASDSLLKQDTSFSLMATRWSALRMENTSLVSFVRGSLIVFVAILRKRTAENDRVCMRKRSPRQHPPL